MNKRDISKNIQNGFKYILGFSFILTTLAVFIPLNPVYPKGDLDSAWQFAINYAVGQGLTFGRDILFTYGPYASIYTKMFHPATDHLMIWGSFFLGLCYSLSLLWLAKGRHFYWLLPYGFGLALLPISTDALLFSYPLALALLTYRLTLPDHQPNKLNLSNKMAAGFAILCAPLGLLPLIKASAFLICGAIILLCSVHLWHQKRRRLACITAIIPAVSLMFFWILSGQPLLALPEYLINTFPVLFGYTEAMSYQGTVTGTYFYILSAILILFFMVNNSLAPNVYKLFLLISFGLFLFIAFKAGFVRQTGHSMVSSTAILLGGLALIFILDVNPPVILLVMIFLTWGYLDKSYSISSPKSVSEYFSETYSSALKGLHLRIEGNKLNENFQNRINSLRKEFPIPPLRGTTDIYSNGQSYLLASDNKWSPRPVFQSYSAYTPRLAELNHQHLLGETSPDNILFKIEPLDNRYPSLEDGLSWPGLINHYSVVGIEKEMALLHKRPSGTQDKSEETDFLTGSYPFNQEVSLPRTKEPLFARIEINPSLSGRLISFLYKLPQLEVAIKLNDGRTKQFRISSNMAKSGFIITPFIENAREFVLLSSPNQNYLSGNRVKSMTLFTTDGNSSSWKTTYSLQLRKLNLSGDADVEKLNLFDKMIDELPKFPSLPSPVACDEKSLTINGSPPSPGQFSVSNLLSIEGWMTVTGWYGIVPDAVFITLTSESGKKFFIESRKVQNDSVKDYFRQPTMPDPGFSAYADVSNLDGKYTLGLARISRGAIETCLTRFPILISR